MTYNQSNSNYNWNSTNSQGRYGGYNAASRLPRGWLKFSQIAGTFFSVLGLIVFIYYMKDIYNGLPSSDLVNKAVTALLLSIIVYFVWRSIYTAIVIVRLVDHSSDEELCANRYIISALSLGVGGFFTPFLMTSFPNVDTTSTIKPRYFLSKVMGVCTLIGAPILALTYFIPLLIGTTAVNPSLIFNTNSTMGLISILVLTISAIVFIFGLATTKLFFTKQATSDFANNNAGKLLKIISTIWMAILTIELVLVIVLSIIRLISALADLFRTREEGAGILMMLLALFNLFITISYVGMIIYITTKTMAGLWSIDGTVKIPKYQHNKYVKSRVVATNNNV